LSEEVAKMRRVDAKVGGQLTFPEMSTVLAQSLDLSKRYGHPWVNRPV
jgi:hypothetical protein